MDVKAEAIKNYSDEAVINNIQNNYEGSHNHGSNENHYNCTFNPLDEVIKALNANKDLYERLLASEREKVEILKNK